MGRRATGGVTVTLSSNNTAWLRYGERDGPGRETALLPITTTAVGSNTTVTITGSYNGTKTATLTVTPPALSLSSWR